MGSQHNQNGGRLPTIQSIKQPNPIRLSTVRILFLLLQVLVLQSNPQEQQIEDPTATCRGRDMNQRTPKCRSVNSTMHNRAPALESKWTLT